MKKIKNPKPFGIVHREICEDKRLSSSAVKLYSYLASFADGKTGRCYPTVNRLEEGLHMSRETLFIAKKALVDTGYIVVEKSQREGGRFGNNVYYLQLLAKPKAKPCTENPHTVKEVNPDSPSTEKPNAEKPNAEKPNAENPHSNIQGIQQTNFNHTNIQQTSFYDLGGTATTGEKSDNDYKRQTEEEFERLREEKIKMLSRGK